MNLPDRIRKMIIQTPQYRPLIEEVIDRGVDSEELLSAIEEGLQEKISYWNEQKTTTSSIMNKTKYIEEEEKAKAQLKLIREGKLDEYINTTIPINETISLPWE